ncbi:MAG: T9SS type A sorting domain-containing protein [Chlorobiota bacterium]|nr:T9SS type A sorting domain-containing protein [Chlorobiota bacterium]QQS66767.1 MAG: T9SS type A sorting domain-containing protein [Chlorobiota bacterium]
MKRILIYVTMLFATFSLSIAQQSIEPQKISDSKIDYSKFTPTVSTTGISKIAEAQDYVWQSSILRRIDETGRDTNRNDMRVPLNFGSGTEFRGFGQVFSPQAVYKFFNGKVYNSTSNIIKSDNPEFNDSVWIAQFKEPKGSFTVDSVKFFVYKNPNSTPNNSGKILAFKYKNAGLTGTTYIKGGINLNRTTLNSATNYFEGYKAPVQFEVTPDEMDKKITEGDQPGSYRISQTVVGFEPPLKATSSDAIIIMYVNDESPALTQPVQESDEYQQIITTNEFREGDFTVDGDTRANPLDSFMAMSVVLYKTGTTQSIISSWKGLVFTSKDGGQIRSHLNINMSWYGTIILPSGVEYHYGTDATSQGLDNVVPSPVVPGKISRQNFSITQRTNLTIQMFDATGKLVKTLIDNQDYIPGKYSISLPVEDLLSGTYMVSMKTGENVYTSKVNITK